MAPNVLNQIDPRDLGRNLKQARNQRQLRQEDAANIIGVSRTTMTAIEQGKRRIKIEELIQLAAAYGRQVGDFVRPRPKVKDFQIQFRGPSQMVDIDNSQISVSQEEFQELCRDYVELERIMEAPLKRHYPPIYELGGLSTDRAAEVIAMQERNRLGLGDGPLPILRMIFEQDVGLRIFYMRFKDSNFSEMYYFDDGIGGCMAVNQNHPEERRRWSLSHGYAHFLVHRYQPAIIYESSYQREQYADYFAKYFLMPTNGITKHYNNLLQTKNKPTIGDLCVLANYYGVSLSALVRRLEDLGVAPSGTWERLRDRGIKVKEAQMELGLSPIPEQSQLLPVRYQFLAVEALEEGKISEGMFAEFLRVDRLDARRILQRLSEQASDVNKEELIGLNLEKSAIA